MSLDANQSINNVETAQEVPPAMSQEIQVLSNTLTNYAPADSTSTVLQKFDGDNPFGIILGDGNVSDAAAPAVPEDVARALGKLAEEINTNGEILSKDDVKKLLKGDIKEEDLLMNRLRKSLKQAMGDGNDIQPALDVLNKRLKELGSPYEIKASALDLDGVEGFNIKLVDKATGKSTDGMLLITKDDNKLKSMADHFADGKFLNKDETDKLVAGDMHMKDTKMGALIEAIQEAAENGQDPTRLIDSLNKHLEASKSKFKIETEKVDGTGLRLHMIDTESGKRSDKLMVPFKRIW